MAKSTFSVPNVRSFYNEVEQPILTYWKENKIFEKSVSQRSDKNRFVFYDGPPFVTGLPHYGHLLASVLKDIIPRYQTMKGKKVERDWGWDCHGIAVEEIVERQFKTKNRREIESRVGIKTFIEACAKYVSNTSEEWDWYIDRIARWVDMKKAYRTMDLNYMETVLWVFKQFYEKGLVYKGKRVSLYCTRCGTPLSNFEIAMDNSYRDLEDPSVYVKFLLNYYKTGVGVGAIIQNERGEVLMIRRIKETRDKVWGIVGGKYEEQDKGDLEETVKREVMEEIGCTVKTMTYTGFSVDIFEGRLFKTHHFKVEIVGEPKVVDKEGDLSSEIHWIKKNDIPWEEIHIPTKNCLRDGLKIAPSIDKDKKPSIEKPNVYVVAWTTTPWTLPANTGLVVDKNAEYVTCKVGKEYLVVAKNLAEKVLVDTAYEIVDTYKGKELVGSSYQPLFNYFTPNEKDNHIYHADFVSLTDGTGVVHMAPGFGEEDTQLGKEIGLSMRETLDDEGKLIPEVIDFAGMYFKAADPYVTENLTKRGLMLRAEKIVHSYPVCHRCKTPLVYKAQSAWYINIQQIKDQLYANNENINWIPEHIKHGRFEDAIKTFPDWGVTRTRYWATPLPIWECNKCDNREVLGSISEIEAKSGKKITNLHRPYIDEHTYPCEKCKKGTMTRVADVADSWLESASMPFAQFHYPFENKEKFEANFPGDYIIEYVGQTRAWFNVMHVVSTILFHTNAFKNVICTGVIMGSDGQKLSKSLGNYPDPRGVIEKYGGDAFRLYIAGSVLPMGEDLCVSEEAMALPVKEILLPLMNTYKYFTLYANQHGFEYKADFEPKNLLDKWVVTRMKQVVYIVDTNLGGYTVPRAVAEMKPLIDDISTWYIRRSRDRFVNGDKDAMQTLFEVLLTFAKTFAPIAAFVTEFLYQDLKQALPKKEQLESVHLELFPTAAELSKEEQSLLDTMAETRSICSLGQSIRVEQGLAVKQPLGTLFYQGKQALSAEFVTLVEEELNVEKVVVEKKILTGKKIVSKMEQEATVALDTEITPELAEKGTVRELTRAIQGARREANLALGQVATGSFYTENEVLAKLVVKYSKQLCAATLLKSLEQTKNKPDAAIKPAVIGAEKIEFFAVIS